MITCGILVAAAILITISGMMTKPVLPTWTQIIQAMGVTLSDSESTAAMDGEMQVHIIDVGNADSILIQCGGKAMLIDAGESDSGDNVVQYLHDQNVYKLDLLIASHPDSDHIGGMSKVIKSIDIGTMIMAYMPEGFTPTSKSYEKLLTAITDKKLTVTDATVGAVYSLGKATVNILGPVKDFEETNNQSVICKVTFGAKKFLFMGDAETEAEDALLSSGADLSADFLKVGHHGSSSSTQQKLLDAIHPTYAAITCGDGNSYNHPNENVLKRLTNAHVTFYRCDLNGTIVAATDGNTITFTTDKG
jgi:beta-lactamase superfamily II metal-dependent hydrolase